MGRTPVAELDTAVLERLGGYAAQFVQGANARQAFTGLSGCKSPPGQLRTGRHDVPAAHASAPRCAN